MECNEALNSFEVNWTYMEVISEFEMMHYRCMAVHTLSKIPWQLNKKEDREQSLELKHMENNLMAYEMEATYMAWRNMLPT
jgi:hypothetical protein